MSGLSRPSVARARGSSAIAAAATGCRGAPARPVLSGRDAARPAAPRPAVVQRHGPPSHRGVGTPSPRGAQGRERGRLGHARSVHAKTRRGGCGATATSRRADAKEDCMCVLGAFRVRGRVVRCRRASARVLACVLKSSRSRDETRDAATSKFNNCSASDDCPWRGVLLGAARRGLPTCLPKVAIAASDPTCTIEGEVNGADRNPVSKHGKTSQHQPKPAAMQKPEASSGDDESNTSKPTPCQQKADDYE